MRSLAALACALALAACAPSARRAAHSARTAEDAVGAVVRPLMAKYAIPGMAVAVVVAGKPYVFTYGVASKRSMQPVRADTLFEIGSLSKTFTATLASYAALEGDLSFSDRLSAYVPSLRGTPAGDATLLNLGTHTTGNLPMQVPEGVSTDKQLFRYLDRWRPAGAPGIRRVYSNIGIGVLGLVTQKSMGDGFADLMERRLFPALGLRNTYINVPRDKRAQYAQGYTRNGTPVRMVPGELWQEAYGVRTTAADMLAFMLDNMHLAPVPRRFAQAIDGTHTGYFKARVMTQDLIWEQYAYPVSLKTLLEGTAMIEDDVPARALTPPMKPRLDVWINKTGSTNGFSAYMAFVPAKHLGIVLLANKNFSLLQRVRAAYAIMTTLARPESYR